MRGIDPQDSLRRFDWLDVEIDCDCLTVTAAQHALQNLIRARIDFLMGDEGRHINKVAWTRLCDEFQLITPAHPGAAPNDIDDTFQGAMMMGASLGIRMNVNGSGPKLLGADAGKVDGSLSVHPRRRGYVAIELIARDDTDAVMLPVLGMCVRGRVIGIDRVRHVWARLVVLEGP